MPSVQHLFRRLRRRPAAAGLSAALVALLAGCVSYPDTDERNHYQQVTEAVLAGDAAMAPQAKVVYLATPPAPPLRSIALAADDWLPYGALEDLFDAHVLSDGATVACAWDAEQKAVLMTLALDGDYVLFWSRPAAHIDARRCREKGRA